MTTLNRWEPFRATSLTLHDQLNRLFSEMLDRR